MWSFEPLSHSERWESILTLRSLERGIVSRAACISDNWVSGSLLSSVLSSIHQCLFIAQGREQRFDLSLLGVPDLLLLGHLSFLCFRRFPPVLLCGHLALSAPFRAADQVPVMYECEFAVKSASIISCHCWVHNVGEGKGHCLYLFPAAYFREKNRNRWVIK